MCRESRKGSSWVLLAAVLALTFARTGAGAVHRITFEELKGGSLQGPVFLTAAYSGLGVHLNGARLLHFAPDSGFSPGCCASGEQAILLPFLGLPVATMAPI